MVASNVGQALDESGIPVQAFSPLDSRAICFLHDFQVQLVKGLNVVTGKGNRHEDQVRMTPFHIFHDGITRLSAEPSRRAHLRLPA